MGEWQSWGRWGQTHPQDVSRELIEVLCVLWYGLVCPYRLFFLQGEKKETPGALKSKAPG